MKKTAVAWLCVAVISLAANADSVKAARAEIRSNSVSRLARDGGSRWYNAWYAENCTEAERAAILERNIAAHRRWMALEPKLAAPHCDLGVAFATVGRMDEAKKEFEIAIAAGDKMDAVRRAEARWEMASILWDEGDKKGAKRLLKEVAETQVSDKFLSVTDRAKYILAMAADRDADLDMLKLPHSTDCKPFPTPQKAKYGEAKVSLVKVEASFKEEVRSEKEKGRSSEKEEVIREKEEGKSEGGVVLIRARDRLGLTWGVVSFLQCVQRKESSGDNATLLPSSFFLLSAPCG